MKTFLSLLFLLIAVAPSIGTSSSKQDAANSIAEQITTPLIPKSGRVALVKGNIIYINLGLEGGVKDGDKFRVIRYGEDIAIGG